MKNLSNNIKPIFEKMFEMVGANTDKKLENEWYLAHNWTEKQEQEFVTWLTAYLLNTKALMELTGNKYAGKKTRERVAKAFVFNYGWKLIKD